MLYLFVLIFFSCCCVGLKIKFSNKFINRIVVNIVVIINLYLVLLLFVLFISFMMKGFVVVLVVVKNKIIFVILLCWCFGK